MKNVLEFKLTSNRIIFVFAQLVAEKPCAMPKNIDTRTKCAPCKRKTTKQTAINERQIDTVKRKNI